MSGNHTDMKEYLSDVFKKTSAELFPELSTHETVSLSDEQISELESRGNGCNNWSLVKVAPGIRLEGIEDCCFQGEITITVSTDSDPGECELILRYSTFRNVDICCPSHIVFCNRIENMMIFPSARIENCGKIICNPGAVYGCGSVLNLGVETGQRSVRSSPLLNVELAAVLSNGHTRFDVLDIYEKQLDTFIESVRESDKGVISANAVLLDTSVIENVFIGNSVRISNASAVRNSILLGIDGHAASVSDGALVRNSVLKWGAVADSMAIIENSVVGECSKVEKHAKLTSSFLGPNSCIGEGEMTASLAGPFTASHHQSLLIAAWWPSGRGNIAHGANVGSNHTSRLPDQSIKPGEGMFFGLGCSVKYPANFTRAPYSIIATGVTTLPQRMEFPFSLICKPFEKQDNIPPAYNQIIPGWVLSDNLYAVMRNAAKYIERDRTKFQPSDPGVFKPEIINQMIDALERFTGVDPGDIYTEMEIPGLGKNFMLGSHRKQAVEAYSFHIIFYALSGYLRELEEHPDKDPMNDNATSVRWEHEKNIIRNFYPDTSREELLEILSGSWRKVLTDIRRSRIRDFSRGERTIDDYGILHGTTNDDPFISQFSMIEAERQTTIKKYLN